MSSRATFEKTPGSELDYALDLTDWLAASNDSLLEATATAIGVAVAPAEVIGSKVVVWVSGGVSFEKASVLIRFTTTNHPPRVGELTLKFRIRDR